MSEIRYILTLVALSTIAYIVPDMWIHLRNPVGASMLLLTNAICMTIYACYYHGDEYSSPSTEKIWKMIMSGLFYFVAWMIYLEIVKYERFAVSNASQTIMMFILGGAFAMFYLENKYNCTKILAFVIGIIAIAIFAYGESLPSYPIFD